MPHYEQVSVVGIRGVVHGHSATIVVVGVRGVVCELSASRDRVTRLFPALLFIVAIFATVSALGLVITSRWSGVITPLSTELSSVHLPFAVITLLSVPVVAALSGLASVSAAEVSPIIGLGVEHLAFRRIASLSYVVLFNQQYRLKIEERGSVLPGEYRRSHRVEARC